MRIRVYRIYKSSELNSLQCLICSCVPFVKPKMSFLLQFAKQSISDFFDRTLPKGPRSRRYFGHQSDSGFLVKNCEDFHVSNIPLLTKVPRFYLQHRKLIKNAQIVRSEIVQWKFQFQSNMFYDN